MQPLVITMGARNLPNDEIPDKSPLLEIKSGPEIKLEVKAEVEPKIMPELEPESKDYQKDENEKVLAIIGDCSCLPSAILYKVCQ